MFVLRETPLRTGTSCTGEPNAHPGERPVRAAGVVFVHFRTTLFVINKTHF